MTSHFLPWQDFWAKSRPLGLMDFPLVMADSLRKPWPIDWFLIYRTEGWWFSSSQTLNVYQRVTLVKKSVINHPPVITIFIGRMVTIPTWLVYDIVLTTLQYIFQSDWVSGSHLPVIVLLYSPITNHANPHPSKKIDKVQTQSQNSDNHHSFLHILGVFYNDSSSWIIPFYPVLLLRFLPPCLIIWFFPPQMKIMTLQGSQVQFHSAKQITNSWILHSAAAAGDAKKAVIIQFLSR